MKPQKNEYFTISKIVKEKAHGKHRSSHNVYFSWLPTRTKTNTSNNTSKQRIESDTLYLFIGY